MSITSKPCGGPLLVAAAALHRLLDSSPDLAAMPIRWTVDPEHGLTADCLDRDDPHASTYAEALAAALGTEVARTGFRSVYRRERKVCLSVIGETGDVLVTFTASVMAAGGGE